MKVLWTKEGTVFANIFALERVDLFRSFVCWMLFVPRTHFR
jgi:hypothetical protein